MRHFTSIDDVSNLQELLSAAIDYKENPYKDKDLGKTKRIGLMFFNPSLRTRLSTQIAAQNLGMEAIVFNAGADGWALEFADGAVMDGNTVEHIKDAAPILGSYFDILCVRTFPLLKDRSYDYAETILHQIKHYAQIPVISLESATLHPLQSFADMITIAEDMKHLGRKPKVVLTWAPHIKPIPQCVANSFAQWMTAWKDVDLTVTQPEGYELNTLFTKGATITNNQEKALLDADYVYVKNWSSYTDYGQVNSDGNDWVLNKHKMRNTAKAKIMHCLPVRRNVEISDELLDSEISLVQQQAKNRIWSAQAVIASILKAL